jgi:hypothetical protein
MKTDVPGKRFAAALIFYGVAALLMLVAGMWLWRFRVAFISVAGSKRQSDAAPGHCDFVSDKLTREAFEHGSEICGDCGRS